MVKLKSGNCMQQSGAASVVVLDAKGILLFGQPSQTALKDEPTHS